MFSVRLQRPSEAILGGAHEEAQRGETLQVPSLRLRRCIEVQFEAASIGAFLWSSSLPMFFVRLQRSSKEGVGGAYEQAHRSPNGW